MLRLSLEALQIVDAIDRRGSFSAAGKELHRVPSTISYTVGKLEDDLGVQVFERNGPRVELTRAGRELLKEGRYLLKAAQDLEHRVRRVASGWETELALGIDSMFSAVAFDQDVRAFYEVAQQTRLRIVQEAARPAAVMCRIPSAASSSCLPWRPATRWRRPPASWAATSCSTTAPSSCRIRRARWRRARSACCWGRTR
jgi:molybdenum-dependent DNA-binding transcriptional regulator ModE